MHFAESIYKTYISFDCFYVLLFKSLWKHKNCLQRSVKGLPFVRASSTIAAQTNSFHNGVLLGPVDQLSEEEQMMKETGINETNESKA